MEKENIEAQDKEFREKKLTQMRTSLAARQEQASTKESTIKRHFKVAIPVLVVLIVAVYMAGEMMQGSRPEPTSVSDEPQTAEQTYPVPPDRTQTGGTVAEGEKTDVQSSPEMLSDRSVETSDERTTEDSGEGEPLLASEDANEDSPVETETIANPEAETETEINPQASPPALSDEELSGGDADLVAGREAEAPGTEELEAEEPETDSAKSQEIEPEAIESGPETPSPDSFLSLYGARITGYSVCTDVRARKCVDPQSNFPLKQRENPHFWMEVRSETVPYMLKHVYYHEGQKYVEVPLKIKYPRTRTWSYITLSDSTPTGSWHVQIETEDGSVLERADFTVTNGR